MKTCPHKSCLKSSPQMSELHINNNRAGKRRGHKGHHHRWTLSPSDMSTLYLNKMCSVTLVVSLWGKHCLSPHCPWQFAKFMHSHQLSLRLEATAKRNTTGSWAQDRALLDADCSSISSKQAARVKKIWKQNKQYYNPGYLNLSLLCSTHTPRDLRQISKASIWIFTAFPKNWISQEITQ